MRNLYHKKLQMDRWMDRWTDRWMDRQSNALSIIWSSLVLGLYYVEMYFTRAPSDLSVCVLQYSTGGYFLICSLVNLYPYPLACPPTHSLVSLYTHCLIYYLVYLSPSYDLDAFLVTLVPCLSPRPHTLVFALTPIGFSPVPFSSRLLITSLATLSACSPPCDFIPLLFTLSSFVSPRLHNVLYLPVPHLSPWSPRLLACQLVHSSFSTRLASCPLITLIVTLWPHPLTCSLIPLLSPLLIPTSPLSCLLVPCLIPLLAPSSAHSSTCLSVRLCVPLFTHYLTCHLVCSSPSSFPYPFTLFRSLVPLSYQSPPCPLACPLVCPLICFRMRDCYLTGTSQITYIYMPVNHSN